MSTVGIIDHIAHDLRSNNWTYELHKIGNNECIIIPFVFGAEDEIPYIEKIVEDRATVKAITVGEINFIMIAE